MSSVIKVENLSKKFIIGHEEKERYTALRDVVARKAKKIFSFPFSQKANKTTYTTEEFWALKEVNFEINQGDRVGIIGRNGAGKSTLLKVLSRITEPSSGSIRIRGRVASLLEVGTGFHPELSGRENIFLNGAILGMGRGEIKKKFDEIVAFAEVEKFLDTPVKRYSSGMYVRLAFAVAAHLEPEILIVDEVLAVGDAQFQKKCLGKMEDVSKGEGRTILFVSHNMQTINNFCDYSILLNSGRVIKEGPTSEITALYLNQFREFNSIKKWSPEQKSANGVWLKSIEVLDVMGNQKEKFLLNEDVLIKVTFEVLNNNISLCHSIAVLNNDDAIAFVTISSSDLFYKKEIKKGEYSTFCKIQKNLLNSGNYWLITNISDSNHNVILETDKEVSFEVFDDGLERAGYFGPWNGLFRPHLDWKTETNEVIT